MKRKSLVYTGLEWLSLPLIYLMHQNSINVSTSKKLSMINPPFLFGPPLCSTDDLYTASSQH